MAVEGKSLEEQESTNQEPQNESPVEQEEFLFLYTYSIGQETYLYLDYFPNLQEAQGYYDGRNQPYISQVSLVEGCEGYAWKRKIEGRTAHTFYPHTKSAYDQLVETDTLTQFC